LFITLIAQVGLPLGLCFYLQATGALQSSSIWLAILLGHFTRCVLSAARFHQGRWKTIAVGV
jgi:Na+-driven multidrug efflux pump